jgi:hypothetical protein
MTTHEAARNKRRNRAQNSRNSQSPGWNQEFMLFVLLTVGIKHRLFYSILCGGLEKQRARLTWTPPSQGFRRDQLTCPPSTPSVCLRMTSQTTYHRGLPWLEFPWRWRRVTMSVFSLEDQTRPVCSGCFRHHRHEAGGYDEDREGACVCGTHHEEKAGESSRLCSFLENPSRCHRAWPTKCASLESFPSGQWPISTAATSRAAQLFMRQLRPLLFLSLMSNSGFTDFKSLVPSSPSRLVI